MKSLKESYISQINEYRTKKQAVEDVKDQQDVTLDDVKGKEPEDVSGGVWAVEEPTEDDILKGVDRDALTKNKKRILMRLKANKPFFVQGEAGWGKTSIITKLAHQCGRTVITVYLDKAEATDLGGIPVPAKSNRGANYAEYLMPGWAKVMWDNPKKQFLLFFDEMNQAAPDVMNALMPIVLKTEVCGKKFNNFIVGAAGNFEHENEGGITELSAPLKSRFGGVITWESGDWKDAFNHLRKKWGEKLSDKFIDVVEEVTPSLFKNPRDVESFILQMVSELKSSGDADVFDADDYLDNLKNITKVDYDELSRTEKAQITKLAEDIYKFVNNKFDELPEEKKSNRKDMNMMPKDVIDYIKGGIERGFIPYDGRKYGISRENILNIEEFEDFPREMLERTVNKLIDDGVKFKFEKDSEWKKLGYEDPNAD